MKENKQEEIKNKEQKENEKSCDEVKDSKQEKQDVDKEGGEEKLQKEIDDLKLEVGRLKNAYAKAYADTENIKKRLQLEADTNKKYRIQSFAKEILPVIDNLERALQASGESETALRKGVEMIYAQLVKCLKEEGVEEIDCLNKEFDPKFEQSIMVEKKEGIKAGIVIEVLQKGYMLKDRVLRAAMVKISD